MQLESDEEALYVSTPFPGVFRPPFTCAGPNESQGAGHQGSLGRPLKSILDRTSPQEGTESPLQNYREAGCNVRLGSRDQIEPLLPARLPRKGRLDLHQSSSTAPQRTLSTRPAVCHVRKF